MKIRPLTFFLIVATTKAFSQQCIGDACNVVTVKKNPSAMIAWQFTNTSNNPVKIGIKRDLSGCSSTNYYTVAPHQQFNWGVGEQIYCEPFEANFAANDNQKTKTAQNVPTNGRPPKL